MKVTAPACPSSQSVRSIDITGVMPLPPLISSRCSGRSRRQDEVTVGRRQPDHHPGVRRAVQEAGDPALGMRLDGDLDAVGRMRGTGGGVAARLAHAVDLDRQADELPGAEALPVLVRAQGQRDAVGGLAPDLDDLGPRLVQRPRGPDQLQVAVDTVRGRRAPRAGPSRAGGGRAGAPVAGRGGLWRRGHWVRRDSVNNCAQSTPKRRLGYPCYRCSMSHLSRAQPYSDRPEPVSGIPPRAQAAHARGPAPRGAAAAEGQQLRQPQPARGHAARPGSSRPPSTGTSRAWRSWGWRSSTSRSGPCAR